MTKPDDSTPARSLGDDAPREAADEAPALQEPVDGPGAEPAGDAEGAPAATEEDLRAARDRSRKESRRNLTILGLLVALGAGAFVNYTGIGSSSLEIKPGPSFAVEVTDHDHGPGQFRFTTVSAEPLSAWGYVKAKFSGAEIVPDAGAVADRASNVAAMEASKRTAAAVASALVEGRAITSSGALVVGVAAGSASDGVVNPGDTVTAVGTRVIAGANDLLEPLPAEPAELTLVRDGVTRTVTLTPRLVDGAPKLGLSVADSVDAPTLDIDSGVVSGPSAGLMFTLADIDALTDGDLTGGRVIAGTGTISADGTVGPISGAHHKIVGAKADGAVVFFSPSADYADARSAGVKGVEVVEVKTVQDALTYLCEHGGESSVCSSL